MTTDESETVSFDVRSVCEGRTTSTRPDVVESDPEEEGVDEEFAIVVAEGEKNEGDGVHCCWLLVVGPPSSLVFCAGTKRSICGNRLRKEKEVF